MLEVNVREARQRLSRLLDQVEAGQEIQITRNGKVIARLVPEHAPLDLEKVLQDAAQLRSAVTEAHDVNENPVLIERSEARY